MSMTKQESCKIESNSMRYTQSIEIVHNLMHTSYKHHNYFSRHANNVIPNLNYS